MSEIAKAVGQRIRNYRTRAGFSQETLAEMSGCHPTYIGQLERGEKNATIESIEKISQTEKRYRYLHQTDFSSRIPGSHKNT